MWQALTILVVLVVIVLLVLFLEALPNAITTLTEERAKQLREAGRHRPTLLVSWGIPLLAVLLVAAVWVRFWVFGDN